MATPPPHSTRSSVDENSLIMAAPSATSSKISQAPPTLIILPEEIRRIILRYCQPAEEEHTIQICHNRVYRTTFNDPGHPPLFQNHSRALLLVSWQLHDEVLGLPQPKWKLRCYYLHCLSGCLEALHPSQLRQIQAVHIQFHCMYSAFWLAPAPIQSIHIHRCETALLEHFENVTMIKSQASPPDGRFGTVIRRIDFEIGGFKYKETQ